MFVYVHTLWYKLESLYARVMRKFVLILQCEQSHRTDIWWEGRVYDTIMSWEIQV